MRAGQIDRAQGCIKLCINPCIAAHGLANTAKLGLPDRGDLGLPYIIVVLLGRVVRLLTTPIICKKISLLVEFMPRAVANTQEQGIVHDVVATEPCRIALECLKKNSAPRGAYEELAAVINNRPSRRTMVAAAVMTAAAVASAMTVAAVITATLKKEALCRFFFFKLLFQHLKGR